MQAELGFSLPAWGSILGIDRAQNDRIGMVFGDVQGDGGYLSYAGKILIAVVAGGVVEDFINVDLGSGKPYAILNSMSRPVYGNGKWLFNAATKVSIFSGCGLFSVADDGTTTIIEARGAPGSGVVSVAGASDTLYWAWAANNTVARYEGGIAPPVQQYSITPPPTFPDNLFNSATNRKFICGPAGDFLITMNSDTPSIPFWSFDAGETWQVETSLNVAQWRFATDGNPDHVVAVSSTVFATSGGLGNFVNKTGDLLQSVGIPSITDVVVIGNAE